MKTDRRNFFRGMALAPVALIEAPARISMAERFVISTDFSYDALLVMLDYWRERYGDRPIKTIEVDNAEDEETALQITRLKYRDDFPNVRVVVRPLGSIGPVPSDRRERGWHITNWAVTG